MLHARSLCATGLLPLLLTACGPANETRVDAGPTAPTADASAAAGDAATSLGFDHAWTEQALCTVEDYDVPGCCSGERLELPPTAASLLDLRGLTSGATGTCGDPVKLALPAEVSAYPLMVLLPEITAADPSCAYCAARGKDTTFGIALELPASLYLTYRPLVLAPAPWRYVYDHNSLAGDTCLGGYQEFGERACVRLNYGGVVGFATGAAATPARAALIDLQLGENGAVETCCPYLPTE